MEEKEFNLVEGNLPYQIHFTALFVGDDLVITVRGGEKPHVGAVAVSIPRPSLEDEAKTSSSTSVFTMVGHKEDDLAKSLAGKISAELEKNVVLTTGIHVDNITASGIAEIEENCNKAVEKFLSFALQKNEDANES